MHCGKGKSTLNQYRPQVKQHSRLHSISVGASDALWDIYGAQYRPTASSSLWANVGLGQCPHTNPKQPPLLDNLLFVCLFFTGHLRTNTVKHHSTAFLLIYILNIIIIFYIIYNITQQIRSIKLLLNSTCLVSGCVAVQSSRKVHSNGNKSFSVKSYSGIKKF